MEEAVPRLVERRDVEHEQGRRGDGLAHLNLQGSLGDGTEAPPEGGISRRSSSGAIDGPPLLEEEEQSSEEAEAQAEEEALALLQALVDEEEMPNAARSSPAFAALAGVERFDRRRRSDALKLGGVALGCGWFFGSNGCCVLGAAVAYVSSHPEIDLSVVAALLRFTT